jgi:membrane associated rhomboid family serine protease
MLLIPCGTDAPIYRPPWGTVSLVAANIVLFFWQDIITPESLYVLHFGEFNPIQWVLASFAHSGWQHLIGNMIFLFSFGMIVESMMKLRHFLLVYFMIVVVEGASLQMLMLGSAGGGALGASGAIYGTMMVAAICGPGKNVVWFWLFFIRGGTFEVPVLICSLFYFMTDFYTSIAVGFAPSTPVLHLFGALVGVVCGFAAYRLDWYELDGEDLFSRFREIVGKEPVISEAHAKRIEAQNPIKPFVREFQFGPLKTQVAKLNKYLNAARYQLAVLKLDQINQEHNRFQLSERQLIRIIKLASDHKDGKNLIQWIDEYAARFEEHSEKLLAYKNRLISKEPSLKTSVVPKAKIRTPFAATIDR